MDRIHGMCCLLVTFLCCVVPSAGDHRSVLWRGGSIAVEAAADHVLVSPSGGFSCGFYKVATNAYTFAVCSNILNLMYDGPEISSNYWPSPFNKWWENNRTAYNSSRHGSFDRRGVFTASDQLQFNASDMGNERVMRRLTLDYDGNLRLYSLDAAAGRWHVTWVAVERQCYVHGLCGSYGICSYRPGPTCSCPVGYVPNDASDWTKGCRRAADVRCGSDDVDFVEMPHTDFWGFDVNYTSGVTFDACRRTCLADCNCKAFGYRPGTGRCYPKIALWNGRIPIKPDQTIYLKVPTSVKNKMINQTSFLLFDGHACATDERDAMVSTSYLHVRSNTINFIYFYCFLAVVFVLEAIFVVVGYLFVFRADSVAAGRVRDEGYSLVFSHFRRFTYDELSNATSGFRDELAKGATGSVYKGVLDDGRSIAVKRKQADEVFRSELSVIGRINHMNLVRIWGFCSEHPHRLIVSEYVENGSLDRALFGDDGEGSGVVLAWRSRYKIAVGVAKGLA
uniref:non-specific serine/threonine protein kinase n=1 Tax=Oryza brachyantha TaxID=4533 RepID=J3M265_ORYBR